MLKNNIFRMFTLLALLNAILLNITASEQLQKNSLIPAEENLKKTVIFDLGNVLFEVSSSKRLSVLAPLFLWYPSLIYKAYTSDMKQELFDMLDHIPAKTCSKTNVMYNEGQKVPQIMVDWMNGRSSTDILNAVTEHLQKYDYTPAEKALFTEITNLIFKPEQMTDSMEPIKQMVKLATKLKTKGYKLYVLSNWDQESFPLMKKKHPDIFKLFDGIMISGEEKIGKPHPLFYHRLLKKFNIDKKTCVFIDDEKFNTDQAEKLGIPSIHKTSINSVIQGLRHHNFFTK